jgi:CRISPR-associated endonuclease/helicase Cas3
MALISSVLWAKSSDRCAGASGDGYPLPQHLLDVAAVAMELQAAVPCPGGMDPAWASALAGCHDLGKASPGFQRLLGRAAVPGFDMPIGPDRHDAMTVPILSARLQGLGLGRSWAKAFADAVGAHHGSVVASTEVMKAGSWATRCSPAWRNAHDELFQILLTGTGAAGLPPGLDPAQLRWLMGLTTVADWIGSSDALCRADRLGEAFEPLDWFEHGRILARAALIGIGLAGGGLHSVPSGRSALALALDGWAPRPLQLCVADVLDDFGDEPGLIVIEAPMGEGKTEAGLGCGVPLGSDCVRGRGIYMAMPTQATSNALYGRVARFLDRASTGRSELALAHGAGGPWAAQAQLREIGLGTPDSSVQAAWWFKGSKRALLASNGIGTVDQALIGVLNARHSFVRLFGLAGRTVIFDELHAYDSYTGGLIERLANWLQGLGCRVVLMSATLPAARRDSILQAWAGDVPVPAAAYPRVTWARPGAVQAVAFPAARQQQLLVEGINADNVAARALAMAKQGARVLLVVNKVRRAQELYGLTAGNVPSTLFHARFPMDERLEIEWRVRQQFGPGGSCTVGHVLVATQVAEQSLDIDMDVLITDIAPVDLVMQRAGRIHRHDRSRPAGFEQPLVLVAGLDQVLPPVVLTSFIYDRWLVLRSAAWLQAHPQLQFPGDIDLAVQEVYGSEAVDAGPELIDAIEAAWPDHQAEETEMVELARQAASEAAASMDDDIADGGAQFGTRLGQDSQSIVPVTAEQLAALEEHGPFLAGHYLRIAHRGLIRHARAQPWPPGWRDQPGLRHHRPLLVVDGAVACFDARLDPELGLVIT